MAKKDETAPVEPIEPEASAEEIQKKAETDITEPKKEKGPEKPRISAHEFERTHAGDAKFMARFKALKFVKDAAWFSTNKTQKQWLWYCRVVGLTPVNALPLAEWIELAEGSGNSVNRKRFGEILKQVEVYPSV